MNLVEGSTFHTLIFSREDQGKNQFTINLLFYMPQQISVQQKVFIAKGIAVGVRYMHHQGPIIIHQD